MKSTLMVVLLRDLTLSWRRRGSLVGGVAFYVIVASLFPLAIGPDPQQLHVLAPGILWVVALLASMLSLSRLFAQEHVGGSLDQPLSSPRPLALTILAKIAAHRLASGLSLLLLTPILTQQCSLPLRAMLLLIATLLIGTSAIVLIGTVGAALILGICNGTALLCVLILPLCVPVLVFDASAGSAVDAGLDAMSYLSLLGVCLALSLFVCPLAMVVGLRIAVEWPDDESIRTPHHAHHRTPTCVATLELARICVVRAA